MPPVTATPPAIEAFLDVVRKSALLTEVQFQQIQSRLQTQPTMFTEPLKVANLLVKTGCLATWQAKQLLRGRYRDFLVNKKYIILEHLGTGGMSSVYLCEHIKLRQLMALKMIEIKSSEQATIQRFEREARMIFSLNHPNIVRAFDFDQDAKYLYIVMEYVDGINLHDLVAKQGPLAADDATNYIAQAAMGLQYAMESGMIHRDIKPGNLLLNRQGIVKVLDLGLARSQQQGQQGLTQQLDPHAVLSTLDYMSPEQSLGVQEIDIRADIYSLGASLYYLLTVQSPYGSGTTTQKLLSKQLAEPIPITSLRPDLHPQLCQVIHTMLMRDPAERPSQPHDVIRLLQPWVGGGKVPATTYMPVHCPRVHRLLESPTSSVASTVTTLKALTQPQTSPLQPISVKLSKPLNTINSSSGNVKLDLPPKSRQALSKITKPLSTTSRQPLSRQSVLWIMGLSLLFISGVLSYIFWPGQKTAVQERPTLIRLPIIVSKRPSNNGSQAHYTSVAEALRNAKAGDQITIVDDIWQEQINEQGLRLKNVTLSSANDKPVRWIPPLKAASSQPLLGLKDADGLLIRNIIFDGEDHVHNLLQLSGKLDGLECNTVEFTGAAQSCIVIQGQGPVQSLKHVLFEHCTFLCNKSEAVSALTLDLNEVRGIKLNDCIIHGGFREIILLQTSLSDFLMENTRINGANCLIRSDAVSSTRVKEMTVRNNILHGLKSLFALDRLPERELHMVMSHNILVQVPLFAVLKDGSEVAPPQLPWLVSQYNVADENSCSSVRNCFELKIMDVPRLKTQNPRDDDYLMPSRNSTLATLKSDQGKHVGVLSK